MTEKDLTIQELRRKLKEYEDIGLKPEEMNALKLYAMGKAVAEIKEFDGISIDQLRGLAQAEKNGRLVVLPCKVGETVYWIGENGQIERFEIMEFTFTLNGIAEICCFGGYPARFYLKDFGKIAFFTREEAEAALKGDTVNAD